MWERQRDTERHKETQRDTKRHKETQRYTERHWGTLRDTERHWETLKNTEKHWETQTDRDCVTKKQTRILRIIKNEPKRWFFCFRGSLRHQVINLWIIKNQKPSHHSEPKRRLNIPFSKKSIQPKQCYIRFQVCKWAKPKLVENLIKEYK